MLLSGHKQAPLYQQAVQLTKEIYRLTAAFPDTERVVLQYSLRRLAITLCQNIATALAAKGKTQRRLCKTCQESCVALDAQLHIAREVGLVTSNDGQEAATSLDSIYKTLSALVPEK